MFSIIGDTVLSIAIGLPDRAQNIGLFLKPLLQSFSKEINAESCKHDASAFNPGTELIVKK